MCKYLSGFFVGLNMDQLRSHLAAFQNGCLSRKSPSFCAMFFFFLKTLTRSPVQRNTHRVDLLKLLQKKLRWPKGKEGCLTLRRNLSSGTNRFPILSQSRPLLRLMNLVLSQKYNKSGSRESYSLSPLIMSFPLSIAFSVSLFICGLNYLFAD